MIERYVPIALKVICEPPTRLVPQIFTMHAFNMSTFMAFSNIDTKRDLIFYHRHWQSTCNKSRCAALSCIIVPLRLCLCCCSCALLLLLLPFTSTVFTCHYNAAPTCWCCAGSCFSYLSMMLPSIYRGSWHCFHSSYCFHPPPPPAPSPAADPILSPAAAVDPIRASTTPTNWWS